MISNNLTSHPLAGKKIVIDPGHGGQYAGAIGPAGTKEKNVALSVSEELCKDLVELGAQVKLTRNGDTQVAPAGSTLSQDLQARVSLANDWPADLFVSIHCNAPKTPDPEAKGAEGYVFDPKNKDSMRLATDLQQHLVKDCGLPDGKIHQANFWVIKHTKMPSALIETAYISNRSEEAFLADPKNQKAVADALAAGVQEYFQ